MFQIKQKFKYELNGIRFLSMSEKELIFSKSIVKTGLFKEIDVFLANDFIGIKRLHNNKNGLYLEKNKENGTNVYRKQILKVPIELERIFIYNEAGYTKNPSHNERFYDVKVGEHRICKKKKELITYILNNTNYSCVPRYLLKLHISIVLGAYERHSKMFELDMTLNKENRKTHNN